MIKTLGLAALFFAVGYFTTGRAIVQGQSMLPAYSEGEALLVNRIAYLHGTPQRGDVVVFQVPIAPEELFIKRVIGLPGDKISVAGGKLFINGDIVEEPYIREAQAYEGVWFVPENSYFVLGDNRNHSTDSRVFGAVHADLIIGRAEFTYGPTGVIKKIAGLLQNTTLAQRGFEICIGDLGCLEYSS